MNEEKIFISIIREKKQAAFGRVLRHDSLLRDVIEDKISGKRSSGRPRQKALDWIIDKVNRKTYGRLKAKAQCIKIEIVVHRTCLWAENLSNGYGRK